MSEISQLKRRNEFIENIRVGRISTWYEFFMQQNLFDIIYFWKRSLDCWNTFQRLRAYLRKAYF